MATHNHPIFQVFYQRAKGGKWHRSDLISRHVKWLHEVGPREAEANGWVSWRIKEICTEDDDYE